MEGLSTAGSNAEITLLDLETLHMDSIVGYRLHLTTRAEGTNTRVTVSRKLSALRSLFHYLSQIAEDENFYPLLKRNIMAKVEIKRIHKPKDTAAKLKGKFSKTRNCWNLWVTSMKVMAGTLRLISRHITPFS